MNSIFTNVAKDTAVSTSLIAGSALLGITASAMFKPEFGGDTKDYSKAIDTSTDIGMGLAMAYLGIKYVGVANKVGRDIFLRGSSLAVPPDTSRTAAEVLKRFGATNIPNVTSVRP